MPIGGVEVLWVAYRNMWSSADCLCVPIPSSYEMSVCRSVCHVNVTLRDVLAYVILQIGRYKNNHSHSV